MNQRNRDGERRSRHMPLTVQKPPVEEISETATEQDGDAEMAVEGKRPATGEELENHQGSSAIRALLRCGRKRGKRRLLLLSGWSRISEFINIQESSVGERSSSRRQDAVSCSIGVSESSEGRSDHGSWPFSK